MNRRLLSLLALCLLLPSAVHAQSGGGYEMVTWTIDGGGLLAEGSGAYVLSGTAAQPDAGTLVVNGYTLNGGFWIAAPGAPDVDGHWIYLPVVLR